MTKNTDKPTNIPTTVTKKQAAKLLHCSTKTIERMAKKGIIRQYNPVERISLYNLEDIKNLFNTKQKETK